ncbi:Uncharacterized protein SCF082_LOCUS25734 [Durusdinium trenchii]
MHRVAVHFHLWLSAICLLSLWPAGVEAEEIDFRRDIRPLLSNTCFECHGPDEGNREAELRLDLQDDAFADRGGYAAFVAGDVEASEALRRITSEDEFERMPPPEAARQLTAEQIELIRKWIEQGADWAEHWAFVPPQRPPVPKVQNADWVRNPIDAFVLARLEAEGLQPSPEADRVTLIRRLCLDLLGLPPTIAEVDVFLADQSDDAYELLVRRLLSSPHYGERWGRHWLDAARYADSDGYEKDKARFVWFYRDWVVSALNRDLPYDQFIIEQIAGDLLPGATQDQRVATGFLRNSMINEEGGIDPEQFRMEAMFDRMDAVGKGILGLTIQCAQCHSHKYDPLTQEEYYRMFAFLNNCHEANIAVYTAAEQEQRDALFAEMQAIEDELRTQYPDWPQRLAEWEANVREDQPQWVVLRADEAGVPTGGQKYELFEDGSILAEGYAPTKHDAKFTIRTDESRVTGFRLELLNDPNLPLGGPGRSIEGTSALTEFEVEAAPADKPDERKKIKLVAATSDIILPATPLKKIYDDKADSKRVTGGPEFAIDGKAETAWGIDAGPERRNLPRKIVFVPESPIENPGGTVFTFNLVQKHGGWNSDDNQNHNLGRFRLSVTAADSPVADPLPKKVREIVTAGPEGRSTDDLAKVFSYWRTTVPEWQEANARIETLWQLHPPGSSQLVLQARDDPRDTHLLERGEFLKPAEEVEPGTPAFLHEMHESDAPPRLAFARWLVDRQSPTTARSIVNRVWQAYFGTGLVSTSVDLGSQAEAPSHPELLDWLAVEFMDNGWSLKKLHRLITTSATYRQSSHVSPELQEIDPYNRMLARGARFRVAGEIVRDIALASSGLLTRDIGGPSVYPPAPEFLFQPPASYGPKVWNESTGEDRYRRGLYTFRFRSVPYPPLQAFDTPNGDASCVRRSQSNTPLQALTTLNEPLFLECAQALAVNTLQEGGANDDERLTYAFRRCVAREPESRERDVLMELLAEQTARFNAGELNPAGLASTASAAEPLAEEITTAELAAWTAVSRVLLNLDETITKP